jgi:hypothetical protein
MRETRLLGQGVLALLIALAISLPASAVDVAWISFHAADNTPSAAATTAGFTQAPDVGYTQALTNAGHNVTRIVGHGQPFTPAEVAALNAFDVVIVSRSNPSGNFQDPDETVFWNTSITAPVIHLGGYALRANRIGMYTGNDIPDTGPTADATGGPGPVRLTVNNPSHPIFAGVALDGTNTTVNNYANVVDASTLLPAPNNVAQRGISTVTNPVIAGGQVLATVGTAGGTIIAKFAPGLTTADATPDVLGGHRLIFLTGTRENAGLTAEGSGIYDLTQDGQRMFLNAVNFMANVPEPSTVTLVMVAIAGLGLIRKR